MKKIVLILILMLIGTCGHAYDCKYASECTIVGKILVNQNDYSQAAKFLTNAIEMNPDDYEAYSYRAKSYFYLKKFEEAYEDANKSLDLYPNAMAYGYRGGAKYGMGEPYSAIEDITTAIEMDSDYMEFYEMRGRAELAIKEYMDALSDVNHAIQMNRKYAFNYDLRARIYLAYKDYVSAKEDFDKASDLFMKDRSWRNYRDAKRLSAMCEELLR